MQDNVPRKATADSCLVCLGNKFEFPGRMELPGIGERAVRKCPCCGLMSVSPLPMPKELSRVYNRPDYFLTSDLSYGYQDYLKLNAAARELEGRRFAEELVRHCGPRGRLLEVGCATGHFLNGLRKACAWDVAGMDLSEYAVRFARRNLRLPVIKGHVEDAGWGSGHFDVVYLHDILEHVLNPMSFLREVRRILKPDGQLYLYLPDGSLDIKPFLGKGSATAVSPHWHLHFFPVPTIQLALRRAGFSVVGTGRSGFAEGLVNLGVLKSPRVWPSLNAPHRALHMKLTRAFLKMPLVERIGSLWLGHEVKIVASKWTSQ